MQNTRILTNSRENGILFMAGEAIAVLTGVNYNKERGIEKVYGRREYPFWGGNRIYFIYSH